MIDPESLKTKVLTKVKKGKIYGLRLSTDEQFLYFVHSDYGLCEMNLTNNKFQILLDKYNNEFLNSLNRIETNPQNPGILYITQSSTLISLDLFNIDILLGNPFGRVFEFNKQTLRLSLLSDGLYFPNGIAFQKHQGKDTLLVAETSRFRLVRIYLNGLQRGYRQIVVDQLQIYPSSLRMNAGDLFVGSIGMCNSYQQYIDENAWTRKILPRLPTRLYNAIVGVESFGGALIRFLSDQKNFEFNYVLWASYPNYKFASTIIEINNNLYICSFDDKGILAIQQIHEKLNENKSSKKTSNNYQPIKVRSLGSHF